MDANTNDLESRLEDLRRVARVSFCFKPHDPSWRARLSVQTLQHGCAYCQAVKKEPERLARCIVADDQLAAQPPAAAFCRTCPFGVREWILPLRHRGQALGVLFVAPSRAARRPATATGALRAAYETLPRFDATAAEALARVFSAILSWHLEQAEEETWRRRARADPVAERAVAFIRASGRVDLRVPEVARHVNLSPSRFLHRFHDAMGCGFGECVRQHALAQAHRLVTRGDQRLVDIAYALGYSSQNHFAQQFKARYGLTASEARKRARADTESSLAEFTLART